jgi:mannan endo-1,4-beta-mannosidase
MVACSSSAPEPAASALPAPPHAGSFVQRSGAGLVLNGRPYRFTGINIYAAAGREGCSLPEPLADVLPQYSGPVTGNFVLRTWANPPYTRARGATYDWRALDQVVQVARQSHVRLILALDNQWGHCEQGSGYKGASWYQHGYRGAYKRWVRQIVTRYRNDPTILAWQIMNEAEVAEQAFGPCVSNAHQLLLNFTREMAAYVKRLDPNHLVGLGTIGGGQCGASNANPGDYLSLHQVQGIDFCEVHDYPFRAQIDVVAKIRDCQGIGLPTIIGEYGLQSSEVGGTTERARRAKEDLTRYFAAGAAGVLLWGDQPDPYNIPPGDPMLGALNLPLR